MEVPLASGDFDPGIGALQVTVAASGSLLSVSFGDASAEPDTEPDGFQAEDFSLAIGRFGVYVLADRRWSLAVFRDVTATADPAADSNFALLYSTPGYDLAGTKRVLVRTINDLQPGDIDGTASTFSVLDTDGNPVIKDRPFGSPGGAFGMQVLAGDFSDLNATGTFTLSASVATAAGVRQLDSGPFEVRERLVSETMLWPMSLANARARRSADDDFRRNWRAESGLACWSVGLDGAFLADRADDRAGATLLRVFDTVNAPLYQTEFRFTCRITIIRGCDAQLQFWVGPAERWAVTLQAGDAGGCSYGTGPGAVRLHREGPDLFEPAASHRLDDNPFQAGRPYDVEVSAEQNHIEVFLDGVQVIDFTYPGQPPGGGFGLKAWASTVRFEQAKIWARQVALSRPWPGTWMPYDPETGLTSQGFAITVPDYDPGTGAADPHDVLFPYAAQQHGFNDCNNTIGEVTSHGVFLSALMAVWQSRAVGTRFDTAYQDILRESILTTVLYLNELSDQANRSGSFCHQEPGRVAFSGSMYQVLTAQLALYGLSSFAAAGLAVDETQARRAFDVAADGWDWLDANGGRDPVLDSAIATRMALATGRQGRPAGDWVTRVRDSVTQVLAHFSPKGAMANTMRPTVRSIPWFEGVYEAVAAGLIGLSKTDTDQLGQIADQLEELLNDPANGFRVIPQSDDIRPVPDPSQPARNWVDLAALPLAHRAIPSPSVGDWYLCTHFLTAAADSVYIGRLAGRDALKQLATGNLHWALGLNPGIPASKVVGPQPGSRPWSAASFVHNGPGSFARTIEGWRTRTGSSKTWLAPWETTSGRAAIAIAINRGFGAGYFTGHQIPGSPGKPGVHGWIGLDPELISVFDLDDNDSDVQASQWRFPDINTVPWATAARLATDVCIARGFAGGFFTGHQIPGRRQVVAFIARFP